jgi:hypothetical protein
MRSFSAAPSTNTLWLTRSFLKTSFSSLDEQFPLMARKHYNVSPWVQNFTTPSRKVKTALPLYDNRCNF